MKKLIVAFVCCFLFFVPLVKSQTLQWQWARTATSYDAGSANQAWNVVSDLQGNAYICGDLACDSVFFDPAHALYPYAPHIGNVFAAKYDSSGNVLWAKNNSGSTNAFSFSMCNDGAGNLFVAGVYQYSAMVWGNDTLLAAPVGTTIFLVKFDSNGNILWARNGIGSGISNNNSNVPYGIAADPWGNVIVTGGFQSPVIHFNNDSLVNTGQTNIFITKYDVAGNEIWAKGYGGIVSDYANGISCDASGNVYITGQYTAPILQIDTVALLHPQPLNEDAFIIKLDSSGTALWAKSGNGYGIQYGKVAAVSSTGSVYLGGFFSTDTIVFDNTTLTSNGAFNLFYNKYNSAGNLQWAKSFAGAFPYKMVTGINDELYITGRLDTGFVTIGNTTFYNPPFVGEPPLFMAKFDSAGTVLWAIDMPSGGDNSNGMALLPDGSLYLCGQFFTTNPFIFGNDSLFLNNSTTSLFLAKTIGQPGLGIHNPALYNSAAVFPNPAHDKLYIKLEQNENAVLKLYDIAGRQMLEQTFTGTAMVNITLLNKGIYIYRLQKQTETVLTGKVIKQ